MPPTKLGTPPSPRTMLFLAGKGGYFNKLSQGSETLVMTSEGLGKMLDLTLQTRVPVNLQLCQWGSSVRRPGNEDPPRCERKLNTVNVFWVLKCVPTCLISETNN